MSATPFSPESLSKKPRIVVYFDGACDPNPGGHAGWGAVLELGDKREALCGYVGFGPGMSNNVAEYAGVIGALEELARRGLEKEPIHVFGDSNLVIQQMSGRWKPGKGLYYTRCIEALALRQKFAALSFQWIPREQNAEADALSSQGLALREIGTRQFPSDKTPKARLAELDVEIARAQATLEALKRERTRLLGESGVAKSARVLSKKEKAPGP